VSSPEGHSPEGGLYPWIAVPLAVGLLGAGALLMIAMLSTVIGPFSIGSTPSVSAAERIALWHPPSAGAPEYLRARNLRLWETMFPPPIQIVESSALAELLERNPSVVIVDAAERMDRAELASLRSYVRRGGAALLSGWIGVDAKAGGELDTSIMRELLEVKAVERLPRDQSYFAAAGVRGPLLAGVPAGQRFTLPAQDAIPAIPDEVAELFWSSWAIHPQAPVSGASLRLQIGKGRLAWLAMGPDPSKMPSDAALAQVFRNAAAWACARPSGELLAWPRGAPFAALLAMDTEHEFQSAEGVAERARQQAFPMTFLVLGQLARQHPELVSKLAAVGEVGSHADVHDGFAGQSPDVQRERLDTARSQLHQLGVASLLGFRPPLESYDAATLRALVDTDFDYLLGDLELTKQVPEIRTPDGGAATLVQIPRTVFDDIELLVKRKLRDPEEIERILLAEVARVARGGGLYYLSFHTQYFGDARRLDMLDRVMSDLRSRKAWTATGGEIAHWWRQRAQLATQVRSAGPQRVQLEVTNEGKAPVSGAAVRVYANVRLRAVDASAATIFRASPQVSFEPGQEHVDLVLPDLAAGASATYFVDFSPSSLGESL
jgi:peptidoglycan/xylan/chitin deacetylase (PgdA/CDA1 family)